MNYIKISLTILILIFVYTTFSVPEDALSPIKKLSGDWKMLYFNNPGGFAKPSNGKGEGVGEMILKEKVLELSSTLQHLSGSVEVRYVIGWDAAQKKYFLINYDSESFQPFLGLGDYDEQSGRLIFEGENEGAVDQPEEIHIEIYFVREDKFMIDVYKGNGVSETKTLELAFIRK